MAAVRWLFSFATMWQYRRAANLFFVSVFKENILA